MNCNDQLKSFPHPLNQHNKGFTLIELIVVIGIIATVLSVGVGTIRSVASAKGVDTGASIAEGVFTQARAIAKARGSARILIYADTTGSNKETRERFFRQLAIQYQDDAGAWQLADKGVTLPKGSFFNPNLSTGHTAGNESFPGIAGVKSCFYFELNSEGALANNANSAQFIIQAGQIAPGDNVPREIPKAKRDVAGFKIWNTGKVSKFRSPSQIATNDADFTFE